MRYIILCGLLISTHCYAWLKSYDWSEWETKKVYEAYGSTWELKERIQGVTYSSWHIARWGNYEKTGFAGQENHLVNKKLGIDEDYGDIILFPQKDGSYKKMGRRQTEGENVNYPSSVFIYKRNSNLFAQIITDSGRDGKDLYSDCGYLTAKEKVAYLKEGSQQPEYYFGEFDPKTNKFYMKYVSAPIQYVYWSEWGSSPVPLLENRHYYKGFMDIDIKYKSKKNHPEYIPEWSYLGMVEGKKAIPIICNINDFETAKSVYHDYLRDLWQPQIDKELAMLSEHETATLKREECDGIGLNYLDGCKQVNDFQGRLAKWGKPKKVEEPRIEDKPD